MAFIYFEVMVSGKNKLLFSVYLFNVCKGGGTYAKNRRVGKRTGIFVLQYGC